MDKVRDGSADTAGREIVVTRTFDAPRELMWRLWTDPKHLTHWWGPRGFTTTVFEMDVRPGGIWKHTMHGPDGTDYPSQCVFREVVPPKRIDYSLTGGRSDSRVQCEVTWTFEEQGRGTKVSLRMLFASGEDCKQAEKLYGVKEGGVQTLERFHEHFLKNTKIEG
jgi:uncharacterized protein YndB with AHSA1/START domain